ncbi:MAG: phosphatase PAP2 family protein [Sphaerochaeta sp.]|uniref:phosphatase PAP2 family protein n=1 Tax=Sphaerochaeta sp. TaxID=1972642 RepID=UPI003D0CD50E
MLTNYELRILDALQSIHTPFLDWLMVFFTTLGDYGLIWILLAVILTILPKTRRMGIALMIALLLDVLVSNIWLKNFVARLRPCEVNPSVSLLIPRPLDYSFPSGHTAASFTASCTLLGMKSRLGWPSLLVSVLIAFSRLYLYVHYPTDVLAGMLVGFSLGALVSSLSNVQASTHARKLMHQAGR